MKRLVLFIALTVSSTAFAKDAITFGPLSVPRGHHVELKVFISPNVTADPCEDVSLSFRNAKGQIVKRAVVDVKPTGEILSLVAAATQFLVFAGFPEMVAIPEMAFLNIGTCSGLNGSVEVVNPQGEPIFFVQPNLR